MGGPRNRVLGRCAGILFLAGAVASLPANALLTDPPPHWWIYIINAVGLLSGLVCFVIPWERIDRRWLHAVPVVAGLEIVFTVVALRTHGDVFLWFFVLGSVFVGYAFRRRIEIVVHMLFAAVGLVGVGIYAAPFDNDAIARAIVGVPTIWVAAAVVVWLRESLERRERTDPLTGLGNRRALMEALEGADGVLALFDLDGFKRYNDRLGHAAGDALLERFGARLAAAVDGHGQAFRLGGDEFCVLVADVTAIPACATALREGEVTASYGLAALPAEADTPSAALKLADTRMYEAKRARRGADFTLRAMPEPAPGAAPAAPARVNPRVR